MFRFLGSLSKNNKEYIMDSDISEIEVSNTDSISNLIPPEWAQTSKLARANSLIVSIASFLKNSLDSSVNAINELAKNLGNIKGPTSIHLLINFIH